MQNDTPTYPNWFESQQHNFHNHLSYLKGEPNLKFLQIGVFTGDASIWLCENILTGKGSYLYDVDTWAGSDEQAHEEIDFNKVLEYYDKRISVLQSAARLRMTSDDYFAGNNRIKFDFIYIDGDHTSHQVAKDADNAWKLLKSGGILAFDDYLWGQDLPPELTPKPAIDRFLAKYTGEYDLLSQDYQLWLKKK
jgi:predicted O-methyltransferase YrrM